MKKETKRVIGGIKKSPWISFFNSGGCNGCAIECVASTTPRYDIERFGCIIKASARQCDILLVSGPGTLQCEDRLRTVYEQMAEPRVVVGVGTCAISGGLFRESYSFGKRVDEIVPVDIYIPGCPPRPEAIIQGLLKGLKLLSEKNGNKND